ncbi:hypothetical protein F53441_8956 [Fusarium austroafricanum]|uniref:Mid2 domain-containing protein n=1 Tax=Fusarium austroafricanum TaxID=2364996 RepID=A0A8H4KA15_9HYPO|nr:hypothetical protein F53441_8956 [Fusarium austroafricanum]
MISRQSHTSPPPHRLPGMVLKPVPAERETSTIPLSNPIDKGTEPDDPNLTNVGASTRTKTSDDLNHEPTGSSLDIVKPVKTTSYHVRGLHSTFNTRSEGDIFSTLALTDPVPTSRTSTPYTTVQSSGDSLAKTANPSSQNALLTTFQWVGVAVGAISIISFVLVAVVILFQRRRARRPAESQNNQHQA